MRLLGITQWIIISYTDYKVWRNTKSKARKPLSRVKPVSSTVLLGCALIVDQKKLKINCGDDE